MLQVQIKASPHEYAGHAHMLSSTLAHPNAYGPTLLSVHRRRMQSTYTRWGPRPLHPQHYVRPYQLREVPRTNEVRVTPFSPGRRADLKLGWPSPPDVFTILRAHLSVDVCASRPSRALTNIYAIAQRGLYASILTFIRNSSSV